jgi:2'-5' RNA ligase
MQLADSSQLQWRKPSSAQRTDANVYKSNHTAMRLFIALDIDEAIRERIARFLEGVHAFAPEARWVREESLHVTLKFIGERPSEFVASLKDLLGSVPVPPFVITFRGFGFFPTPTSPRVFWGGIQAGAELQRLAAAADHATAQLGVPREQHAFSPHLTLARKSGASGAPHRDQAERPGKVFQRLQEKLAAMSAPDFGTMTAREFFLYQSQLSRTGSRYTKLERFALAENGSAADSDPQNS